MAAIVYRLLIRAYDEDCCFVMSEKLWKLTQKSFNENFSNFTVVGQATENKKIKIAKEWGWDRSNVGLIYSLNMFTRLDSHLIFLSPNNKNIFLLIYSQREFLCLLEAFHIFLALI